jgi:hypothetical protein
MKNTVNSFSFHIMMKHKQTGGQTQKLTQFLSTKPSFIH